jgi:hypothetical protein
VPETPTPTVVPESAALGIITPRFHLRLLQPHPETPTPVPEAPALGIITPRFHLRLLQPHPETPTPVPDTPIVVPEAAALGIITPTETPTPIVVPEAATLGIITPTETPTPIVVRVAEVLPAPEDEGGTETPEPASARVSDSSGVKGRWVIGILGVVLVVALSDLMRRRDLTNWRPPSSALIPPALTKCGQEQLVADAGEEIIVDKYCTTFDLYKGDEQIDTYGKKEIVSVEGKPTYPEFAALSLFRQEGWNGMWVDGGVFDLILWRGKTILFIELKRSKRDQIRANQVDWVRPALSSGIDLRCFAILEWDLSDA